MRPWMYPTPTMHFLAPPPPPPHFKIEGYRKSLQKCYALMQTQTQSLPPPPAWGIWAYLKIPYFHKSKILQKLHRSNHKDTKKCKRYLHCREQCIDQCMSVVNTFSLPCFAADICLTRTPPRPLRFNLPLDISGFLWTVLDPMTILLAQSAFGAFSHLVIIRFADPTTRFFKIYSASSFFSSPSRLLTALHREFPPASKQLA